MAKIVIGTCGYSYTEWVGPVYPEGTKKEDFLALWKGKALSVKRIKAQYIGEHIGQMISLIGWPVTQKEVWTKDGLTMSFLTFEDETVLYETVIFPQVYDRYNSLLFDQIPLLVRGKVCEEWGALSIEVEKVERIM